MSTPESTPRTPDADATPEAPGPLADRRSPRERTSQDVRTGGANARAAASVDASRPTPVEKTGEAGRADSGAALSRDGVPLARVRRSPRVIPFLVTGAVIGAIVGVIIAARGGEGGNYTGSSSTGYLLVLFGGLGALLGGVAFAIADRRA